MLSGLLVVALTGGCSATTAKPINPGLQRRVAPPRPADRTPNQLAVYRSDGSLTIIDGRTGRTVYRLGRYPGIQAGPVYSSKNHAVYFTRSRGDAEPLLALSTRTRKVRHYGQVLGFDLSPDGQHLAAVNANGNGVRIITLPTGKTTSWSTSFDALDEIVWLDNNRMLVKPSPWYPSNGDSGWMPAQWYAASSAYSAVTKPSTQSWYLLTLSDGAIHSAQLRAPADICLEPALSHDSVAAVWARCSVSPTNIQWTPTKTTDLVRLSVRGRSVHEQLVPDPHRGAYGQVSPDGHRILYIHRTGRRGSQRFDLRVCAMSPTGSCPAAVVRNVDLAVVAWATN